MNRLVRAGIVAAATIALSAGMLVSGSSSAWAAKSFTGVSAPTISGTRAVGKVLRAKPDSKTSPTATSKTYKWQRYYSGAYHTISGATKSTYTPTATDRGKKLRVRVCLKKTGYQTKCRYSARTGAIAYGTFTGVSSPTISGRAAVGQTLVGLPDTSTTPPASSTTFSWERYSSSGWQQVGVDRSYRPGAADLAKQLRFKVVYRKSGYATLTKTSAATAAVAPPPQPVEFDIDNSSKESVAKAVTQWQQAAQFFIDTDKSPVVGGSIANCAPGRLSDAQRKYATSLLNFYRELAGVRRVAYSSAKEPGTMNAAFLNTVNDQFSHSFSQSANPKCWGKLGSASKEHNVLASGGTLSQSLAMWISDDLNVIDNIGHRRNMMVDTIDQVSFGLSVGGGVTSGLGSNSVGASDSCGWFGDVGNSPTWPPAGYFPTSMVPTRWSIGGQMPTETTCVTSTPDPNASPIVDETAPVKFVVKVTHNGVTTTPKVVDDWFKMPAKATSGDYVVTVTGTYRVTRTTSWTGDSAVINTFTKTNTYTVKAY